MAKLATANSNVIREIGPRIVTSVLPLFAILDAVHHLINGAYKGAYVLAGKVFTSLKKHDAEDAIAHFKQILYFTAFAVIGTVASILSPSTAISRLYPQAIINELDDFDNEIDLSKVNPAIQNNPEFIFELIVTNNGYYIQTLAISEKTALSVLQESPKCYLQLPKALKSNEKLALAAIEKDPRIYTDLPDSLKSNEKLALAAIEKDPQVYRHFPDSLKSNEKLALAAIEKDPWIYTDLPDSLKSNEKLALAAIGKAFWIYTDLPGSLKSNEKLALAAIEKDSRIYLDLPDSLKSNKKLALAAIGKAHDAWVYRYLPDSLQSNEEFALAAIKQNPGVYYYLPESLQSNEKITHKMVEISSVTNKTY